MNSTKRANPPPPDFPPAALWSAALAVSGAARTATIVARIASAAAAITVLLRELGSRAIKSLRGSQELGWGTSGDAGGRWRAWRRRDTCGAGRDRARRCRGR